MRYSKKNQKNSSKPKTEANNKIKKSEIDEELEEEILDAAMDGLSEINYDIKDLPGVGATIAKKLTDAGFGTVNAIAITPAKILIEEGGLGEKLLKK